MIVIVFFGQILNLEQMIKDLIKLLQMLWQMLTIWIYLVRIVVLFFKKISLMQELINTGRLVQALNSRLLGNMVYHQGDK